MRIEPSTSKKEGHVNYVDLSSLWSSFIHLKCIRWEIKMFFFPKRIIVLTIIIYCYKIIIDLFSKLWKRRKHEEGKFEFVRFKLIMYNPFWRWKMKDIKQWREEHLSIYISKTSLNFGIELGICFNYVKFEFF